MLHDEAVVVTRRPVRANARHGSFFVAHPEYRDWLRDAGITTGDDAMALGGEIVCGHPDRHVARVELAGRVLFVKRELVVGRRMRFKNWWRGIGAVSRSEREALALRAIEAAKLPCPQWVAYGQDSQRRAFIITEEFAGASDLRTALGDVAAADRGMVAERIGQYLAELHEAGFGTPELAAKHLFVNLDTFELALFDWQSAARNLLPTDAERAEWFGALHATLAEDEASPRERLRALWAYRRVVRTSRRGKPHAPPLPRFSRQIRAILHAAEFTGGRSSSRDASRGDARQTLVWLDGEAVVAIPEIAQDWPAFAACEPFYPAPSETAGTTEPIWVTFPEGQRGVVHRFETSDAFGCAVAALRERPWRSPASRHARCLFHLARRGIPAPRLFAFGQRSISAARSESFVAFERIEDVLPWQTYFAEAERTPWEIRRGLQTCGEMLRMLHNVGCRWAESSEPLFQFVAGDPGKVVVGSPLAIRLKRKVSRAEAIRDLRRLAGQFSRAETGWLLRGYLGDGWAERNARRSFIRAVL